MLLVVWMKLQTLEIRGYGLRDYSCSTRRISSLAPALPKHPASSPVSPTRPRTAHLLMPLPHPARDHERSSAMTYASNPSHTHARGYTTHQLPSPTNHRHCSVSGQDLHLIYISLLSLSRSTPLPPSFPPPSLTLFDPCRHSCLPANKVQSR
jgi:hypothetical protein